jgi:hypothetical protein
LLPQDGHSISPAANFINNSAVSLARSLKLSG